MYALDIAEGATGEEDIEDVTGDAPEGPGDGDGSGDGDDLTNPHDNDGLISFKILRDLFYFQ